MSGLKTYSPSDDMAYQTAVEALYSPLHQSSTTEAIRAAAARRTRTLDDMTKYLQRIGLDIESPKLAPCIHITGTKGKGSVAAMCEALLRERYKLSTGLFTSPHLIDICERIRIGGKPVSMKVFGEAYWHIRHRLEQHQEDDEYDEEPPVLPGYFRMLTLMALFIFAHHEAPRVDVIILEVGMGGRYDATNVVSRKTKVCGITLLDYDHTRILGDTLDKIAWEKAGIFRPPPPLKPTSSSAGADDSFDTLFVLDSNQELARNMLQRCAEERGGKIRLVGSGCPVVPSDCKLGLPGRHQRDNVELAIALCQAFVKRNSIPCLDGGGEGAGFQALAGVSWPGRCQKVTVSDLAICLDGAHTVQSVRTGFDWFMEEAPREAVRVLIFTCSHERNPVELLELLLRGEFHVVVFARADSERPSAITKKSASEMLHENRKQYRQDLQVVTGEVPTWQDSLATVWKHIECEAGVVSSKVVSSVNFVEAMAQIREFKDLNNIPELFAFVTGSLYLVGSALNAIGWKEEGASGALQI